MGKKHSYEIPSVAWNDRVTGIQVARTVSKAVVLRLDSLPLINKDAARNLMGEGDTTWVSVKKLKSLLHSMFIRGLVDGHVTEIVLSKVSDSVERFHATTPPKNKLLSERRIMDLAVRYRFDPYEIKRDLEKLESAGHVFFNLISLPIQKLYDVRSALRRAKSERKLIKSTNSKAALLRRAEQIPLSIAAAQQTVAKVREKMARLAKFAARQDALMAKLLAEQEEVSAKLKILGADAATE